MIWIRLAQTASLRSQPPGGEDQQAGASAINQGQSLASILAAGAYANSATDILGATRSGSQVNQYS